MLKRLFKLMSVLMIFILSAVLPTQSITRGQYPSTFRSVINLPLVTKNDLIENLSKRTANMRVFEGMVRGKPITRYQYFPEPIAYRNLATGQWEDIDSTLILDQDTGSYRNKAGAFMVDFANPSQRTQQTNPSQFLLLREPTRPTISFELAAGIIPTPQVEDNTITYTNISQGQDVVYSIESWGIKEDVILHSPTASSTFSMRMRTSGLIPREQANGNWTLVDSMGSTRWTITAPYGVDANGHEANVDLTVTAEARGIYLVTLRVNPQWLAAPERAFPIRIDPSITTTQYFGGESYVQKAARTLPSYKQRNRFLGYSTLKDIARIFTPVDLSFLPDSVQGEDIRSVELVMTQYAWNGGEPFNSSVYTVQDAWSDLTITWDNQPAHGETIAHSVVMQSAMGTRRWDITNWVKQVRAGLVSNNGLMIRADNESQGGAIFWSSHCGTLCPTSDRPYLQVDVSENPFFGDGHDGDLIVPAGQIISLDGPRAQVTASQRNAYPSSSNGFNVGDLVLFHQTQGTENAGRREFNRITSINSPTNWTLENPLSLDYNSTTGRAQVLRVPQYRNVTVEPGGILTAPSWDGATGGILIFKASENLTNNGTVDMIGKGFRGGNGFYSAFVNQGQCDVFSGEGSARVSTENLCLSNGNGGGGGYNHFQNSYDASGGGGGGNGMPGLAGGRQGSNNANPKSGEGGITNLDRILNNIGLGGGGGGGGAIPDPLEDNGGTGGNGGGIIFVFAKNTTNRGIFAANGSNGMLSPDSLAAGGGGGAGGSILLKVGNANLGLDLVQSQAGNGAASNVRGGAGGKGGAGLIRVEFCDALLGQTTPVASTQQINCGGLPVDSGFNVQADTYQFPNKEGIPNFEQFIKEYGIPQTTHMITETSIVEIVSNTLVISLPVGLATAGLTPTIPLSFTSGLTDPTGTYTNSVYIMRPISLLYALTIVKGVFGDQFTQSYNAALKGGLCAGMVATVAEFLASGTTEQVETYGGQETIRSIPNAARIEEFIQRYHGRQVSDKLLRWLAQYGKHNAVDFYYSLLQQLGKPEWQADPQIIGIIKGSNCKDIEIGHALLPYKVEPRAGGIGRIYVYDPNYVDTLPDTHYIDINLNNHTWTYELAAAADARPAIVWTGSAIYSTPLSMFREKPTQPTNGSSVLMVDGGTKMSWGGTKMSWGGTKMSWGGHDSSYGKAPDGTHTGCIDNGVELSFVQEITRTMKPIPFTTALGSYGLDDPRTFPDTLLFPSGQDWTFTGEGARSDGLGDMMFFGPHALAGFIGIANESTQDIATIDATFRSMSLRTTDETKPVSVYQMHETDIWTRIYATSNMNLNAGEVITLTVSNDLNTFELVNSSGVTKTFDLGMGHIGSDGISTIVHQHQIIGPNERRIYTPIVWQDVKNSPLLVQIDLNSDGSIDYVELKDGGVIPITTPYEQIPEHVGETFTMISHESHASGHIGWINLDYPLAPGEQPTNDMHGNNNTLRRWIAKGEQQHIRPDGSFVGISGTHGGLFKVIGTETNGSEDLYRIGDIVLIPVFDQLWNQPGGISNYHVSGIAVAQILSSTNSDGGEDNCNNQPNCNKVIIGKLLMQLEY